MAQLASRFDTFFGDRGDVRGFVYFCEHWYQAIQGKTDLLSPAIFYPVKGTLAYSDLLLGYAIPYALFRSIGLGMFTSVEIVIILVGFLSYLTCLIFLRVALDFGMFASAVAALFFAFNSPKFFQTNHLQLQFVLFLPLIFICIISFVKNAGNLSQKKAAFYLSLAGVFFVLQLMTAFYYAWFFVFWTFLFLLLILVFKPSREFVMRLVRQYWRAILLSAAVFLIGLTPFIVLYIPTIKVSTWYEYSFVRQMIPEWWALMSMGHSNYLWGWLSDVVTPNPPPDTWGELKVGLGVVSSLLWIVIAFCGAALIWKEAKHAGVTKANVVNNENVQQMAPVFLGLMILATTLFYLIGMRYGGSSPWYYVYQIFPGGGAIRAVARYVLFLALPIAVAFAYIFDRSLKWASNHPRLKVKRALSAAIVLIGAVIVVEQFSSHKVGSTGFSVKTEEAYLKAMTAKLPGDCEAFYISPGVAGTQNTYEYQYDAMLISILSGVPTFNASSSQFPPDWSMYFVKEPDYESNIKKWIDSKQLKGKICRLEVGQEVEEFGPFIPNPIDDSRFFVTQNYRDLLKREPRSDELESWSQKIKDCDAAGSQCARAKVVLKTPPFTEFSATGSYIVRIYMAGLGRLPRYEEFESDFGRLQQAMGSMGEVSAKQNFAEEFSGRTEFTQRHQGLSDQQYEQRLLREVGAKTLSLIRNPDRTQTLLSVADNKTVADLLANRVFVTLLYFGYLKRDPEKAGFEEWLKTLSANQDREHVVDGFLNSAEYRRRFGR